MTQVIIYKQDSGVLSVVHPTPQGLELFSIEELAVKDVPLGKPFKIVDISELPASYADRAFWTIDNSELTDGIGVMQ